MEKDYVRETIGECSGGAGLYQFENLPLGEFLNWFAENIKFCDEIHKEKGRKLYNFLSDFVD